MSRTFNDIVKGGNHWVVCCGKRMRTRDCRPVMSPLPTMRRRRACGVCGRRLTTYETLVQPGPDPSNQSAVATSTHLRRFP